MISIFPSRAIALTLGPVSIHWYGLMYLIGFVIGLWLLPRLQKHRHLSLDQKAVESLFIHVFLGVLLGGRLGYVLFYGLPYYLHHPLEIVAVWQGGMASHGGILGVIVALLLFARRWKVSVLALSDTLMAPVAIGLALGRLGNFINQELYGTVTTFPWGMRFPGVDGLRHPTQLYAMAKDLVIAGVTCLHLQKTSGDRRTEGMTTALFLVSYGVLRFIVEIFRDQPLGYSSVLGFDVSRGQLLTLPVIMLGLCVALYVKLCGERT